MNNSGICTSVQALATRGGAGTRGRAGAGPPRCHLAWLTDNFQHHSRLFLFLVGDSARGQFPLHAGEHVIFFPGCDRCLFSVKVTFERVHLNVTPSAFLHFGVDVIQASEGRGHLFTSSLRLCLLLMSRIFQPGRTQPWCQTRHENGTTRLSRSWHAGPSDSLSRLLQPLIWILTYILLNDSSIHHDDVRCRVPHLLLSVRRKNVPSQRIAEEMLVKLRKGMHAKYWLQIFPLLDKHFKFAHWLEILIETLFPYTKHMFFLPTNQSPIYSQIETLK